MLGQWSRIKICVFGTVAFPYLPFQCKIQWQKVKICLLSSWQAFSSSVKWKQRNDEEKEELAHEHTFLWSNVLSGILFICQMFSYVRWYWINIDRKKNGKLQMYLFCLAMRRRSITHLQDLTYFARRTIFNLRFVFLICVFITVCVVEHLVYSLKQTFHLSHV